MLIVRELLLGPQRYSDLQAGLPGIGTNVLAERLRALEQDGVIARRTLPPPMAVTVYELTGVGRALRPALSALREWGAQYGSMPLPGDVNRPSWMLLSLLSGDRPLPGGRSLPDGRRCELRVDGEVFTVSAVRERLTVEAGADRQAQAIVSMGQKDLTSLMTGRRTVKAVRSHAQVEGDETAALELLAVLEAALVPVYRSPITSSVRASGHCSL
jgi:DNA-binding HxlR family transcriptional regulator